MVTLLNIATLLAVFRSALSINLVQTCNSTSGHPGVCVVQGICPSQYSTVSPECLDKVCCLDSGISQQKCGEYEEEWLRRGGEPERCEEDLMSRIIGGRPARRGQYPHACLLGYTVEFQHSWICGGSLISTNFLLTAQHCFKYKARFPMVVKLGSLRKKNLKPGDRLEALERGGEVVLVEATYVLPDKLSSLSLKDIGLARLKHHITLGPAIKPACLNAHPTLSRGVTAVGWGITERDGKASLDELQEIDIALYELDQCRHHVSPSIRALLSGVDKSVICAGDLTGQRDTCQGDSGGPISQLEKGSKCRQVVVGVTSGGGKCAAADTLAIYVNVAYFRPWIEQIVWGNSTDDELSQVEVLNSGTKSS